MAAIWGFLLTLGVIEMESFLNQSGYLVQFPYLINISPPLLLLIGPLVYRFAQSDDSRISSLHFLPAILCLIYSFFFFLQPEAFKIDAVLKDFHSDSEAIGMAPSFSVDPLSIQGIVVVEGLAIHIFIYSIVSAFYTIKIQYRNSKNASNKIFEKV